MTQSQPGRGTSKGSGSHEPVQVANYQLAGPHLTSWPIQVYCRHRAAHSTAPAGRGIPGWGDADCCKIFTVLSAHLS